MPAIYQSREFAAAGGLMSYGASFIGCVPSARRLYRPRSSRATSRPTCRCSSPRKFELVINLKTAKALGLTMPLTLLARADEVIE